VTGKHNDQLEHSTTVVGVLNTRENSAFRKNSSRVGPKALKPKRGFGIVTNMQTPYLLLEDWLAGPPGRQRRTHSDGRPTANNGVRRKSVDVTGHKGSARADRPR